jgi:hypothetical protein
MVRDAGRTLGEVLAGTVNFFNPEVIVIGGDVAEAREHLLAVCAKRSSAGRYPLRHAIWTSFRAGSATAPASLVRPSWQSSTSSPPARWTAPSKPAPPNGEHAADRPARRGRQPRRSASERGLFVQPAELPGHRGDHLGGCVHGGADHGVNASPDPVDRSDQHGARRYSPDRRVVEPTERLRLRASESAMLGSIPAS